MASVPDTAARAALEQVLQRDSQISDEVRVRALSQLACLPPYDSELSRSKELSARAVALARHLPDRRSMCEALRARLGSLSGPDDIAEVMGVADELLSLPAGPDRYQLKDARVARLRAFLHLGQIADADRELAEMTSGLGGPNYGETKFFCERLRAQRYFLDGKFEDAERHWHTAYLGATRAGVAYAKVFRRAHELFLAAEREGAQTAAERRLRGLSSLQHYLPPFRASLLRIAAEAGWVDFVRLHIGGLGDVEDFCRDGGYLNAMACVAVCVSTLDDREQCEALLSALSRYAAFNTPDAMGYYLGSVSYFLGLLATTLGRGEQGARYFEEAIEQNQAMGYRAGVVRSLIALAKSEQAKGRGSRARSCYLRARQEARSVGLSGMLAQIALALPEP